MTDNTQDRLHNIFFYGLYMDPNILKERGVSPRDPRIGYIVDYKLQIGKNSAILRSERGKVEGIVYSLTHAEIEALYPGCGLHQYAAECVLVQTGDREIPALCYNLISPPSIPEANKEYEKVLKETKMKLGFIMEEKLL